MDVARAEEFCRSYGDAAAAGDAVEQAAHYGFPFTAFTLGAVSTFADRAEADREVAGQNDRIRAQGVGLDIRLVDVRVEPVSEGSALCHLTLEIFPEDATPGWRWVNVYGLRQTAASQHFEFVIADNELIELLARFPDFGS